MGSFRRIRSEVSAGDVPGLHLAWRTFGVITGLVVAANLAGVLVVSLLLVALDSTATGHQVAVVAVVGGSYGLLAIAAGVVLGLVLQGRTLRWLARGRRPTPDEARRALRNPLDLAAVTGALWMLGALVMGVLGALLHAVASQVAGLAAGLVLAGLTTAGVTYIIAVAVGRPVAIIALSVYPPSEAVLMSLRIRMLLNWLLATGIPLLGIVLVLGTPPGRSHIIGAGLILAVVAIVVGAAAAAWSATSIGDPLRALSGVLERVGRGDLATEVEVDDVGEIGMLQRGVNDMLAGLRDRDRIRDLFGRHVGPAVADEAIDRGPSFGHAEQRTVVALFVDIAGSTGLTRRTEPGEFVAMLNRFFSRVVEAVEANGGLVNKFEGDGALCVFGAPVELASAATSALRAARAIRDQVRADGEVSIGIGVALGPVIAGHVGASRRFEYTIVGDAVNEAARLTEQAKRADGNVLASAATVLGADPDERTHWLRGRALRLRGRDARTPTYRALVPVPTR